MLNIPINSLSRICKADSSYFIGKSGVYVQNWEGKKQLYIGFSIAKNKDVAIDGSKFELLERLLATYDLNKIKLKNSPFLKLIQWSTGRDFGTLYATEVILENSPLGTPKLKDASGLGLHTSFEKASEHAVFELLERHILCKIWYKNDTQIFLLDKYIHLNYTFSFYSICSHQNIPFSLCLITDINNGIFITGSAFSYSLPQAIDKSKLEGLMLLDSFLNKDNGFAQSSKARIYSTRDKKFFSDRYAHLTSKIVEKRYSDCLDVIADLKNICDEINLNIDDILVSPIYSENELIVVRAISPHSLKLPDMRESEYALCVPMDPFC